MRAIPTINTQRLTLRAMRPQDFDAYAAMWSNPEVVRFVGGQAWPRAQAWSSFLRNGGHWQMTGFGMWAVETRGASELQGQVGFFYGMRGLGEDFDTYPEASWVLHPDVQGHGYGKEAALAAHDWFDRVITGPLVCKLETENAASVALAEVLGYAPMRETRFEGRPSTLLLRKTPPTT